MIRGKMACYNSDSTLLNIRSRIELNQLSILIKANKTYSHWIITLLSSKHSDVSLQIIQLLLALFLLTLSMNVLGDT
jgi:hypothetical protein